MPTYQYACTECGHSFEQFQSFSEDSLTVCPVCEGKLRKLFNAVGVVFKGSGFYRTDSRAGSSATDGGSAGTGSDSSGGTSGGTSETTSTKPETKAPAAAAASSSSGSSSD